MKRLIYYFLNSIICIVILVTCYQKNNYPSKALSKSDLIDIVKKGNKGSLKKYIEDCIKINKTDELRNLNFKDDYGNNLLQIAVTKLGDEESPLLNNLIDKFENEINTPGVDGATVLDIAESIYGKNRTVASKLKSKGAKNRSDYNGESILEYAFKNNKTGLINFLIEDVELKDFEGKSALHYAAQYNNVSIAETLINKGSNISLKDKHFNYPLHYAAKFGGDKIAPLLVNDELIYVIRKDHHYGSIDLSFKLHDPICVAISNKHPKVAEVLINTIIDKFKDQKNDNLEVYFGKILNVAISKGDIETAKLLISNNAKLGSSIDDDKTGNNILHLAVKAKNIELVKLILDKSLEKREFDFISSANKEGYTPMQLAFIKDFTDIVKLIKEYDVVE